jgi:hypothetical protein
MLSKKQIINEILIEWAYRLDSGMPNPKNRDHIWVLSEVLTELGLSEIKNELISNLLEADASEEDKLKPKFKNPILNKIVTYQNKDGKEQKGLVGNLLSNPKDNPGRIAAEKMLPAEGTPQRDELNKELGGDDKSQQPQSGPSSAGGEPQQMGSSLNPDTEGGKDYIDSLPDGDPAKPKVDKRDKLQPQPNGYVGSKNKSLVAGSPIESEEYQKDLEPSDSEFEKRNEKDANPTPPVPIKLESLIPNPKFPKRYVKVLERMMNSRVSAKTAKWSHFSDIQGGQGKISAQAGELLTMMGATMSDEEFTNLTNELLKHERELLENHPDVFKKRDSSGRLIDNPGSRILDKSWIKAAKQSRKVILTRLEKQYGDGVEVVGGAWDSKNEVEALGLQNYKENKGFSTDIYLKVKKPNGEEVLDEVSLKKSKDVNFLNSGAGKFMEWDENLSDDINQNVYQNVQRKRNIKFANDNKQQIEEFLNSDKGKVIQEEMKKKKLTFSEALQGNSRAKQKILYMCAVEMSKYGNDSAKQVVDEAKMAHTKFIEKSIEAISTNDKMKEGMLQTIKEEFPLKSVSEGEETMAIGDMSLDKDTMTEMFGTSDYDKIKEKLVAEQGPPPFLGYKADIGDKVIPLATISVREDGVGYGGQIKFEMTLDRRFADILKQATEKVYG